MIHRRNQMDLIQLGQTTQHQLGPIVAQHRSINIVHNEEYVGVRTAVQCLLNGIDHFVMITADYRHLENVHRNAVQNVFDRQTGKEPVDHEHRLIAEHILVELLQQIALRAKTMQHDVEPLVHCEQPLGEVLTIVLVHFGDGFLMRCTKRGRG